MSVYSRKPQEALSLLVTEERYWSLFYMPLCTFLHKLLNLLVQIANKMRLTNYCVLVCYPLTIFKPIKLFFIKFVKTIMPL
jgi:hypothetical protein